MIWETPHLNLLMAWIWILAGFGSGAVMGLRFVRAGWLGGYTSLRRRMVRLGHISFFGLGFVNWMFYLTVGSRSDLPDPLLNLASWLFVLGAVTMPVGCLVMAYDPDTKPLPLFFVPVASLLTGGTLTLWMLLIP